MPTNDTEKASTKAQPEKSDDGAAAAAKPKRRKPKRPAAAAPATPPEKGGATGEPGDETSNVLLVALFVLAATGAIAILATRRGATDGSPGVAGEPRVVELTLVAADKNNLACASPTEVRGKRCEFDTTEKRSSQIGDGADERVLKPYTTTDGRSLLAAGVWSQPALANALPPGRFTAKCRFLPEGKVSKPSVRWTVGGRWNEAPGNWEAGTLSECVVAAPARPAPSAR